MILVSLTTNVTAPTFCGRVFDDPNEVEDNNNVFGSQNFVWWDYPEPAINTYYYGEKQIIDKELFTKFIISLLVLEATSED